MLVNTIVKTQSGVPHNAVYCNIDIRVKGEADDEERKLLLSLVTWKRSSSRSSETATQLGVQIERPSGCGFVIKVEISIKVRRLFNSDFFHTLRISNQCRLSPN